MLNCIAIEMLDFYDENFYCSEQNFRHFEFQCISHKEHVVESHHRCDYTHLGMEQVEQFVTFIAAYELETFVYEHEMCPIASKFINAITNILQYCITKFMDNVYVVDYNKRGMAAQESASLLHNEENEEVIVPPKLGDILEPLKDDSNTQTQNSIAIYENLYTSYEGNHNLDNPSYYDAPLMASNATSKIIDEEEYCFDMLYDTTIDDGLTLIDNFPCIYEDKNDEFARCDAALIHESPILFLEPPIYTIEKYAYVEKYLCGLQLSYEKSYCSHDAMSKNDIGNYFERGKHANKSLNKFNDPIYVQKNSKLHDSNSHTIKISCSNCNYYERGGDKYPLYASSNGMRCSHTNDMQWYASTCCYLVIYKMSMHRKKVRLPYYCFHILWYSLPCFCLITILRNTPWYPGIGYGALPKEEDKFLEVQVSS
jgi:hypothetical protein